jgi:uncharacterized iron-regulated membrane protein
MNRAFHTGDILGYPTKALMSLASVIMVCQALTGYIMWLMKVRAKALQSKRRQTIAHDAV